MVASLLGIVCTTSISWSSKTATSEVEANKNTFYSWIQTQLLPVLSGNTVNALYLLQQNLMTFNQTFQSNIAGLDAALSRVESTSQEQVELISLIRDIDVRRVAQANVTVLRELKSCTAEIATFNQYLHNVSNYLNAVNELNANLKNRCRAYLNEGLPKIVEETNNKINRDLFDKLFSRHKSDSYSIKEYVDLIVQENYNSSIIESMLVDNFNIFIDECLQNRLIILEQFVEDPSLCNYTMEPIDREAYVKPSIPFNHIDAIQAIKADINWWSVGLTAAGFIPGLGTAISLTADAVDILYGLYADREESKLIKQHMESFATDLFANYHQNCNFNINQFYSKIHTDIEKSQNEFKKFFYENF